MLSLANAIAVNQGVGGPLMFRFHTVAARISKQFGPQVAATWTQAITQFRGSIDEKALRAAVAAGNLAGIEAAVKGSGFGNMMRALENPLTRTAQAAGTASAQIMDKAGFPLQFNAVHPNVVLFARDQSAALATAMTADVRTAVRTVVALGAQQGLTVVQQARAIREVVGLHPTSAGAPLNLGADIRAGRTASATGRRLSATTKQEIRSRIKRGTVNQAFIEKMEARYAASLTNRRALNIARTETLRSANFGQQESWVQAQQQGVIGADSRRFWIVTPDDRLSPEHAQIPALNPTGRGMEELFETPDGPFLFPPSRTNCRCGIGLGVTAGDGVVQAEPTEQADKITLAQPSKSYPLHRQHDETLNRFQLEDGSFTLQRKRLHDAIVRRHIRGFEPVEDPQVMVMGGGPASGKSAMLRQVPVKNHIVIDVDNIRTMLPEFREGVKAGNKAISSMTHEESSLIGKRIAAEAIKRNFNVLVDGTGDASYEKLAAKVRGFRSSGHRVVANYVTVDTDVAVARSIARGKRTGRFVPEDFMRGVHSKVSEVFDEAVKRGLFDEVTLWDTNGSEMLKVAHALGKEFTIFEEPAWARFLAKAGERAADPFGAATHLTKSRAVGAQLNRRYGRYNPAARQDGTLARYQGTFDIEEEFEASFYFRINNRLRTRAGLAEMEGPVAALDVAIAEAPTVEKSIVVWRGGKVSNTVKVGDTIIDQGFVSTTSDRLVAERFFGDQISLDATLIRIGVPQGQRGLWMPKLVGGELKSEAEFILARGSSFRVRRIRRLLLEQYEAEFGKAPSLASFLEEGATIKIVDLEIVAARTAARTLPTATGAEVVETQWATQRGLKFSKEMRDAYEAWWGGRSMGKRFVTYNDIQRGVRGGGILKAEEFQVVKAMDAAHKMIEPLPRPVETWRAVRDWRQSFKDVKNPEDLVGLEFTDAGFVSSTVNKAEAVKFLMEPPFAGATRLSVGKAPALIRLHTPQGMRMLNVGRLRIPTTRRARFMAFELQLPRGTRFRITAVEKRGGQLFIDMEVLR